MAYNDNCISMASYPQPSTPVRVSTEDAVYKARSELDKERARGLIEHVENELREKRPLKPGTVIHAGAVLEGDPEHSTYLAWILGQNGLWTMTGSSGSLSPDEMVNALVSWLMRSIQFSWAVLRAGPPDEPKTADVVDPDTDPSPLTGTASPG